jgi:putative oxidoreductase
MKNVAFLLGRVAFGGFFLYSGINHFRNLKMLSQYAGSKGTIAPEAAVAVSGALMLLGGTSVITGIKPVSGTLALIAFLGAASPKMHDFWNQEDPGEKQNNMIHFSKNMALLAAALMLMGVKEPWPVSAGHQ